MTIARFHHLVSEGSLARLSEGGVKGSFGQAHAHSEALVNLCLQSCMRRLWFLLPVSKELMHYQYAIILSTRYSQDCIKQLINISNKIGYCNRH